MPSITPQDPQLNYKLLIGMILPRPIAFVSSLSEAGIRNLAPFSFFTAVSANPPVICFSPMRNVAGGAKDTLNNIAATGEFTVNIVSEDFANQMNLCSGDYPPDVDEFTLSGLTPVPSEAVKPARVGEAKASMECRLVQIVEVSTQPLGGSLVLGEVLRFHLSEEIVDAGLRVDPDKLQAIGRMGGPSYTRTLDRFEIARPVLHSSPTK
jgi:flavin reductase (DIM6/NTAB) family NADH-FMN oxidoreductase RutF